MVIEKKTKFSTEATKIRHFGLKISKIFWGGGHPLPTPYPSWRLRRLDSARAFGARSWPPNFNSWIRLWSSVLEKLNSLWLPLVMISNMCVGLPICNRFHTRKTNSVKIASFRGGPFFAVFVRGEPLRRGPRNFVTII